MALVPAKVVTIFSMILFELFEPFSNLIMPDNPTKFMICFVVFLNFQAIGRL